MMRNSQILSKIKNALYTLSLFFSFSFFISCGDDEQATSGSITINFKAEIDDQAVEFGTGRYTTAAGNEISIDRLKLYVSNVQLINLTQQTSFDEVDSYHLVSLNAENGTYSFVINDIPGDFSFDRIAFAIGVDTDKNFSLDNTGDLDPANDMAWNWDTGYKFFLMEGSFFPNDGSDTRGLIVHVGHDKNYRGFAIDFTSNVNVNGSGNIDLTLNPLAALNAPNQIDLTDNSTFKGSEASDVIADNYAAGLINSITTDLE